MGILSAVGLHKEAFCHLEDCFPELFRAAIAHPVARIHPRIYSDGIDKHNLIEFHVRAPRRDLYPSFEQGALFNRMVLLLQKRSGLFRPYADVHAIYVEDFRWNAEPFGDADGSRDLNTSLNLLATLSCHLRIEHRDIYSCSTFGLISGLSLPYRFVPHPQDSDYGIHFDEDFADLIRMRHPDSVPKRATPYLN